MIHFMDIINAYKNNKNNSVSSDTTTINKSDTSNNLLDTFLNNRDYELDNYLEEGGSNLTADDEQCMHTFNR